MIENDMYIRAIPVYDGDTVIAIRNECVITKEEFIECYNTWIKENPDTKIGKWQFERNDPQRGGNIHSCSLCGQEVHSYSTDYKNKPCVHKYCPRCGARMENTK